MKFLCEACERLATPAGFRVVAGTLELICGSCGRTSQVPGLPERPGPGPEAGGPGGHGQPTIQVPSPGPAPAFSARGTAAGSSSAPPGAAGSSSASPGAGSSASPGAGSSSASPGAFDPAGSTAGADWLAGRWTSLTSSWEDPAAHDRLLSEAVQRDQLAELGRRYSDRLAKDPDDLPARRARDELLRRATARLMAELPRQEAGVTQAHATRVRNIAMVVVLLGMAAFAFYVLARSGFLGGAR